MIRTAVVAVGLALLAGCFGDRVTCASPDQVIAQVGADALTCEDGEGLIAWIGLVAARPVGTHQGLALAGLRDRFHRDPTGTRAWLGDLAAERLRLTRLPELEGAEARAHALYALDRGAGPITPADGRIWDATRAAVAVWNTHEGDELALAEADIEAWIRYASLCRQVQGAGALRISVADRVSIYRQVHDRWQSGSRTDRIALAAIGPYWASAEEAWEQATFERQQQWASRAPLPPPMTATSLAYLEAVLEGDLVAHAVALHGTLGPLAMAPR